MKSKRLKLNIIFAANPSVSRGTEDPKDPAKTRPHVDLITVCVGYWDMCNFTGLTQALF